MRRQRHLEDEGAEDGDEIIYKIEVPTNSGTGSILFKELGLYYIGHVDDHNIDDLIAILNEVKSTKTTGPFLIHVVTKKGRGFPYVEKAVDKYHGVAKFDPATGKQFKAIALTSSYTIFFGGFDYRSRGRQGHCCGPCCNGRWNRAESLPSSFPFSML